MDGTLIDARYRLGERLGGGSMGTVYAATRVDLGRPVAVKLVHPQHVDDPKALERIWREARAAIAVQSPYVVEVRDVGEHAGVPYIVMEHVRGADLRRLIAQGPLPLERALRIAGQIAMGLEAAHRRGVVHRDLKPANVLLAAGEHVKIVDFGVAMLPTASRLTVTGELVGTPRYMAPEQCAGLVCDARTDIYALGLLLYEMVCGRHPFADRDPVVLLYRHQFEPAPRIDGVPGPVAAVIQRCLEKRPADRYASMREVVGALREARDDLDAARSTPPILPVPAAPRGGAVLMTLALLGSLAFGGTAVHLARRCDQRAPPRAAARPVEADAAHVSFAALPTRAGPAPEADAGREAEPSAAEPRRDARRRRRARRGHRSPLLDPWR